MENKPNGCMILFGLPFALGALFMLGVWFSFLSKYLDALDWQPVPAKVESVQEASTGRNKDPFLRVAYTYRVEGRLYRGSRVDLYKQWNISRREHLRRLAELEDAKERKTPLVCYVDPDNPVRSAIYKKFEPVQLVVLPLFALPFAAFGFPAVLALVQTLRGAKDLQIRKANHPGKPWLWGPDKRTIPIQDSYKRLMRQSLFFLVFSLPFSSMPLWAYSTVMDEGGILFVLILFVFAPVAPAMFIRLCRQYLQYRACRNMKLTLIDHPVIIGGPLHARMNIEGALRGQRQFKIHLKCVAERTHGDTRTERVVWEESRELQPYSSGSGGVMLPIDFAIPYDLPVTGEVEGDVGRSPTAKWILHITALGARPKFDPEIEIPVYMTEESRPDYALPANTPAPEPSRGYEQLAARNLHVTERTGGSLEFYFAPPRQPVLAGMFTVVAILPVPVGIGMFFFPIPQFFPIGFIITSIPLLVLAYRLWRAASRIIVAPGALRLIVGPNGRGEENLIDIDEIDHFDALRSGSVNAREFCDIVLFAKAGHRYTLAQWLDSEHQARRIISAIEERIGLRGDRE